MPSGTRTKPAAGSQPGTRGSGWVLPACLLAAVVLAYANSLAAPFVFDDYGAVVTNPTIRELWSLDVLRPPGDGSTTTARPLLNLSFALNYALHGDAVVGYHVVNVLIHGCAALLLMGVIRLTLVPYPDRQALGAMPTPGGRVSAATTAFVVALVWALHPLQTESVTCVAQRSESLCGLFYLLTLYAFAQAASLGRQAAPSRPNQQRRWFGLSIAACAAGMATKEVMVTAPVVVLLYDRTFVGGSFAAAWKARRRYYLGLAGTWLILIWLVSEVAGARGASAGIGRGVSSWDYLLTQCRALGLYIKLSFWPHPLVLDYGTAVVHSLADVWVLGVGVLLLLGASLWALRVQPALGFAGIFFFAVLAPSSSVVPLVTQTIAEHRMYLPLAAIVGVVVTAVVRRFGAAGVSATVAVALIFAGLTLARNREYRDPLALWARTAQNYPASARAHNNYALELQKQDKLADAITEFTEATTIDPQYVAAFYNLGSALLAAGRINEAVAALDKAVTLAPNHADAQLALGNALMKAGRADAAIAHYKASLALLPGADAWYNLGVAEATSGRDEEAQRSFEEALRTQSLFPNAHFQLGRIAERAGDLERAIGHYQATLKQAPTHADAHRRLGLLAARAGAFDEAELHFDAVVRSQPNDADALANLGNTLLARGRMQEAAEYYRRALTLRPGDRSLAEALAQAAPSRE